MESSVVIEQSRKKIDRIQHSAMMKPLSKLEMEEIFLPTKG